MPSGFHLEKVELPVKNLKIVRRSNGITFEIRDTDDQKTTITFIGCTVNQLFKLLKSAGA